MLEKKQDLKLLNRFSLVWPATFLSMVGEEELVFLQMQFIAAMTDKFL